MGPLQVKVLETTEEEERSGHTEGPGAGPRPRGGPPSPPDGYGVSRLSSDVPAAVQLGGVLKRPSGAGDDAAGGMQKLRPLATGWPGGTGGRRSAPEVR